MMLTADELRDARALALRAADVVAELPHSDARRRITGVLGLLRDALEEHDAEAKRRDPRLDCLTTAVRALTGALRDRLDGDG